MSYSNAVFFALIQGLTEFLPVSSSGHLSLLRLITIPYEQPLIFDIFLHAGSLLAILWFFRRVIAKYLIGLTPQLIITTIPAGIIGVFVYQRYQHLFESASFLGFAFLFTALLLFSFNHLPQRQTRLRHISIFQAFIVGVFQAVAILPGISRSGSTVFAGKLIGLAQKTAFIYAFLCAIPAILGSMVLVLKDSPSITPEYLRTSALGFIVSFSSSLLALNLLTIILKKRKLNYFAWYLLVLGSVALGLFI